MDKTPKEILRDQNRIGIAVELRNGERFVCFNSCWYESEQKSDRDVMEIFEFNVFKGINKKIKTLWKRKEEKEMTVAEIEKELGYKIKIVGGE